MDSEDNLLASTMPTCLYGVICNFSGSFAQCLSNTVFKQDTGLIKAHFEEPQNHRTAEKNTCTNHTAASISRWLLDASLAQW